MAESVAQGQVQAAPEEPEAVWAPGVLVMIVVGFAAGWLLRGRWDRHMRWDRPLGW
jgi:hypothetical protein